MGNPPKLKFADAYPLQEYYDDGCGNRWCVSRLIDEAKDLTPFDVPLAALDLSGVIWQGYDIWAIAFHCKRVRDADLSKPIILTWDGCVADGRHRIIKALMTGKATIKAVRITWRVTPCSTSEEKE
jgi:hypothetical protein